MSVGFPMEFSVVIQGGRKEIQQISAVAQQVVSEYKAAAEQAPKEGKFLLGFRRNYESIAE